MLLRMLRHLSILLGFACALAGCGPVETTNGYQGEMGFSLYATDTATGWTLDLSHDIFWDGESKDTYEVTCTVADEGAAKESYTLRVRDETFEQGFHLTPLIFPPPGSAGD